MRREEIAPAEDDISGSGVEAMRREEMAPAKDDILGSGEEVMRCEETAPEDDIRFRTRPDYHMRNRADDRRR